MNPHFFAAPKDYSYIKGETRNEIEKNCRTGCSFLLVVGNC